MQTKLEQRLANFEIKPAIILRGLPHKEIPIDLLIYRIIYCFSHITHDFNDITTTLYFFFPSSESLFSQAGV